MTFTFDPLQAAFVVVWLLGAWRMTRAGESFFSF